MHQIVIILHIRKVLTKFKAEVSCYPVIMMLLLLINYLILTYARLALKVRYVSYVTSTVNLIPFTSILGLSVFELWRLICLTVASIRRMLRSLHRSTCANVSLNP